jgi:hypothetical protein
MVTALNDASASVVAGELSESTDLERPRSPKPERHNDRVIITVLSGHHVILSTEPTRKRRRTSRVAWPRRCNRRNGHPVMVDPAGPVSTFSTRPRSTSPRTTVRVADRMFIRRHVWANVRICRGKVLPPRWRCGWWRAPQCQEVMMFIERDPGSLRFCRAFADRLGPSVRTLVSQCTRTFRSGFRMHR